MGRGNERRAVSTYGRADMLCHQSLCSSGMATSSRLDIDVRKSTGQDIRKARSSFSHSLLHLILFFLFSNAKCNVFIHIQDGLKAFYF